MHRDATFLRAWAEAGPEPGCVAGVGPGPFQAHLRFRSVWISDLHLGTPGCQAHALLDFLRQAECENLFLVGDIVDGWQLRRSWFWPQAHNDVVQKLLRKAREGTRVIFIPGNHDEFAGRYVGHSFGGIEVMEDWTHETADGRRLWVTHGDLFDGVVQCAPWLAHVGDRMYEFTLRLNRHLNSLRARLGFPYWSLSRYLKLKVKRAVSYVGDFEAAVAREARRRGVQGVVCGHIHHAELREIDGITYANDGDLARAALRSLAVPRERARPSAGVRPGSRLQPVRRPPGADSRAESGARRPGGRAKRLMRRRARHAPVTFQSPSFHARSLPSALHFIPERDPCDVRPSPRHSRLCSRWQPVARATTRRRPLRHRRT